MVGMGERKDNDKRKKEGKKGQKKKKGALKALEACLLHGWLGPMLMSSTGALHSNSTPPMRVALTWMHFYRLR